MERNTISIVIPAYNAEKTIKRCIDSILSQTYKNLEIIIIDDGSTDNTLMECQSMNDCRIKVIHTLNYGQGHARNIGIDAANGEYIAFVDADDYCEPDMYENLYRMITTNNADMVCCGHCDVIGGKLIEHRNSDRNLLNRTDALRHFAKMDGIKWGVWDKLFKTNKINDLRFPSKKMHAEDVIFLLQFITHNNIFYYENIGSYHYYRDNANSFTKKKWNRTNYGLTIFYEQLSQAMVNYNISDCVEQVQARFYENLLSTFIRSWKNGYKDIHNAIYSSMQHHKKDILKNRCLSFLIKYDLYLCIQMPRTMTLLQFWYK